MAEVLSKQPRPKGPRLAILTNAGGPGVLATDALIENQGELAPLSAETMAALDAILPAAWSHNNPIDILGDADPERYAKLAGGHGQGPQHRWAAGDLDPAGHDQSHRHGRAPAAARQDQRQAGPG